MTAARRILGVLLAAVLAAAAAAQERFELVRHVNLYDHVYSDLANTASITALDLAGNVVEIGDYLYVMDYLGSNLADNPETRRIYVVRRLENDDGDADGLLDGDESVPDDAESWTVVQEVELDSEFMPVGGFSYEGGPGDASDLDPDPEGSQLKRHGMAASRDGTLLYVADNTFGNRPEVSVYDVDPVWGTLTHRQRVGGECFDDGCGAAEETEITVSEDDRHVSATSRSACGFGYVSLLVRDMGAEDGGDVLATAGMLEQSDTQVSSGVAATAWIGGRLVVSHNSQPFCEGSGGEGTSHPVFRSFIVTPGSAETFEDEGGAFDREDVLTDTCPPFETCSFRGMKASPDERFLYYYPRAAFARESASVRWLEVTTEEGWRADFSDAGFVRADPRNRKETSIMLQESAFEGDADGPPDGSWGGNNENPRVSDAPKPWVRELCVSQSFVYAAVRTTVAGARDVSGGPGEIDGGGPILMATKPSARAAATTTTTATAATSSGRAPSAQAELPTNDLSQTAVPAYDDIVVFRRDADTGALEYHSTLANQDRVAGMACSDDGVYASDAYGVRVIRRIQAAPGPFAYGDGDGSATVTLTVFGEYPDPDADTDTDTDGAGFPELQPRPLDPESAGGRPERFTVTPELPDGLFLNPETGTVWGSPTATEAAGVYTVTATTRGGSSLARLSLRVADVNPGCAFPDGLSVVLQAGVAGSVASPQAAGSPRATVAFSVEPSLPPGLALGEDGAVSGTPLAAAAAATYTVRCLAEGWDQAASFDLEVATADLAGAWSYERPDPVLASGVPAAANRPFGLEPGAVVSYRVSEGGDPLPDGLALDAATGIVSGTPAAPDSPAGDPEVFSVVVEALDSRGLSAAAALSVSVLPTPPPPLEYADTVVVLDVGVALPAGSFAPAEAAAPGSGVRYEIEPDLPSPLVLDPLTGEVSGTPAEELPLTSFRVLSSNSGGESAAVVHVSLRLPPPAGLEYEQSSVRLVRGALGSLALAAPAAAPAPAYATSEALPDGVTIDTATGEISGAPTVLWAPRAVVVTAAAPDGSLSFTTVVVEVVAPAPAAPAYAALTDATLPRVGAPFTYRPDAAGPDPVTYSVFPPLPAGLSLDAADGTVSGTPAAEASSADYAITVTGSGGAATADVALAVLPVALASLTYSLGGGSSAAGAALYVPSLAAGVADSFEAPLPLPDGVRLNTETGVVSGLVVDEIGAGGPDTFLVRACNLAGCVEGSVTPSVVPVAPPADVVRMLVYSDARPELVVDQPLAAPLRPTSLPAGATLSLSGVLPPGLAFNAATGEISGSPEVVTAASLVTVTADTGAGEDSVRRAVITFAVVDSPLRVAFDRALVVATRGAELAPVSASRLSGSGAVTATLEPELPSGLEFDADTLTVSGTPERITAREEYELVVTGSAGESRARLVLEVVDEPPRLEYAGGGVFFGVGTAVSLAPPSNAGGVAVSFTVQPPLPEGLSLNAATGRVEGTPRRTVARQFYRVDGTNSGGLGRPAFLELTVNENGESNVLTNPVVIEHDTDPFNKAAATVSLIALLLFVVVAFLLFLSWRTRKQKTSWEEAQERRDAKLRAALAQYADVEARRVEEDRLRREAEAERKRLEEEAARRPLPLHLIPDIPDRMVDLFALLRLDTDLCSRLIAEGVAVRDLPHVSGAELRRLVPSAPAAARVKAWVEDVLVPSSVPAKVKDWIESDSDEDDAASSTSFTDSRSGYGNNSWHA